MSSYGSIGKLGVYLIRRYFSPLACKVELTSTKKLFELGKSELIPPNEFYYVPVLVENILRYHTGNPHLAQSKPSLVRIFSKNISRRDLKFGTLIPELICDAPVKTEPSWDPSAPGY